MGDTNLVGEIASIVWKTENQVADGRNWVWRDGEMMKNIGWKRWKLL